MTTVHDDKLFAELARLRTALPADAVFLALLDARYGSFTSGAGAPGGTGTNGQQYYDTTNDRLYLSDGSGWIIMYEPWQLWNPQGSWTEGNGVWIAGYKRHAGLCTVDGMFTFGSGSSIAGSASVVLPKATYNCPAAQFSCGFDISGEYYTGVSARVAGGAGAATVVLRVINTAGTFARFATTSGTIPASFVTGSIIDVAGTYTMNTPYL